MRPSACLLALAILVLVGADARSQDDLRRELEDLYGTALREGRLPSIEADLSRRAAEHPESPWPYFYRALVGRERLRWKEAEQGFKRAAELSPKEPLFWSYWGWHVEKSFRLAAATSIFRKGHAETGSADLLKAAEKIDESFAARHRAIRRQLMLGVSASLAMAIGILLLWRSTRR